jgi:DNA-binding protein YbaB
VSVGAGVNVGGRVRGAAAGQSFRSGPACPRLKGRWADPVWSTNGTGGRYVDLSGMQARAEGLMADFERLRANAGVVRGRLAAARGRGVSEDGLVRVVVDGRGRLESVEIDPRVFRRPDSRRLAEMIVGAAGRAVADVDGKVEKAFEGLVSAEDIRAQLNFDVEGVLRRFDEEIGIVPQVDTHKEDR